MKKNYILLAVLPILFQGTLYCADTYENIDQVIMPQLQAVRAIMRNNVNLELDAVLPALLIYAQKGNVEKAAAIIQTNVIKVALENYKAKQYPDYWPQWMCSTPEIVKNQINPALNKVDKVLAALTKRTPYDYAKLAGKSVAPSLALLTLMAVFDLELIHGVNKRNGMFVGIKPKRKG